MLGLHGRLGTGPSKAFNALTDDCKVGQNANSTGITKWIPAIASATPYLTNIENLA
jgi:hypothetical protein